LHWIKRLHEEREPQQLRSFGLLVGSIFAVIGLWPVLWHRDDGRLWALVLAGGLIVPALVYPRSLTFAYGVWMTLGNVWGWINTRIVLGGIFYGLFTPIGLVRRLRGQDSMRCRWEPEADTYRVVRQPRAGSHMRRQF
jgi:hypothetical protein